MHTPEQCAKHTPQCISTSLLGGSPELGVLRSNLQAFCVVLYPVVFTYINFMYINLHFTDYATISVRMCYIDRVS